MLQIGDGLEGNRKAEKVWKAAMRAFRSLAGDLCECSPAKVF